MNVPVKTCLILHALATLSFTSSLSCNPIGHCQKKVGALNYLQAIFTSNAASSKVDRRGFRCNPVKATSIPYVSDNTQSGHTASIVAQEVEETTGKDKIDEKKELLQKIRAVGGPTSFLTKFGAMNMFGVYWLLLSSSLGLVWFSLLQICRLFYWLSGDRLDRNKRIPIFFSHVWGTLLLRLSHSYPQIENRDKLKDLYSKHKAAMFVANHASWNDIPYIGVTIGWRNYKFVGKKELLKVPILGSAISIAGHIALDRKDRASGLLAVKKGINWLKTGVHLITFPEGTRSRDGKLLRFKNGAFKMAVKAGAPVVPISIVNAHKVMPPDWMMPFRSSRGIAKVIVHEPVETEGKTEEDVAVEVRNAIISGLPPEQQPAT